MKQKTPNTEQCFPICESKVLARCQSGISEEFIRQTLEGMKWGIWSFCFICGGFESGRTQRIWWVSTDLISSTRVYYSKSWGMLVLLRLITLLSCWIWFEFLTTRAPLQQRKVNVRTQLKRRNSNFFWLKTIKMDPMLICLPETNFPVRYGVVRSCQRIISPFQFHAIGCRKPQNDTKRPCLVFVTKMLIPYQQNAHWQCLSCCSPSK